MSNCNNINIEGGPRYKPPEVYRGSPVLHCSLTTITTIVYFDMCNLINSCSSMFFFKNTTRRESATETESASYNEGET